MSDDEPVWPTTDPLPADPPPPPPPAAAYPPPADTTPPAPPPGGPPSDLPPPAPDERSADAPAASAGVRPAYLVVAATVLVGAFGLVLVAVDATRPTVTGPVELSLAAAADRFEAAGCTPLDIDVLTDRDHLDPATAPTAEQLYTEGRPTASGRHYGTPAPLLDGLAREPLDERATTHNLEHGAVVVWLHPDADGDVRDDVDAWVRARNAAGFGQPVSAAGVFASPTPTGVLPDDVEVALRAWGVAVDCERWDRTVADAFLHDSFGSHGQAPEADLGPFPEAAIDVVE